MINPTAIIDESAKIACSVTIGPYCVIGSDVEIGEDTWIGPHVVINGPTRVGRNNRIFQFNSIGDVPQDRKYEGEVSSLEIGDRNTIREYCTFNRGTKHGGGVTRVGSDNWIMAYVHIAHDCQVGDDIVMANHATLAGHVTIGDHAILGGSTLVHQFCAVGAHSFSAMGTAIGKVRTPLIVTGPGVEGERIVNSFVYVTDIMPTILELAGVKHPETYEGRDVERMRGRSFVDVMSGLKESAYAQDALFGGEMMNGKWMRKGDYKVVLVAKPFGPASWRLYNTITDPGETTDLSEEKPEIFAELKTSWEEYAKDVGVILSE